MLFLSFRLVNSVIAGNEERRSHKSHFWVLLHVFASQALMQQEGLFFGDRIKKEKVYFIAVTTYVIKI
jgi:hypothetical protein